MCLIGSDFLKASTGVGVCLYNISPCPRGPVELANIFIKKFHYLPPNPQVQTSPSSVKATVNSLPH